MNTGTKQKKDKTYRFKKISIWLVSVVFSIVFVLQIICFSMAIWLNSDAGQKLVKNTAIKAANAAGYNLDLGRFEYRFPQGIQISSFKISNRKGDIAAIENLRLQIGILPLFYKTLSINSSTQYLTLYQIPTSESKPTSDEPFSLRPFTLPNMYFKTLVLNDLNIAHLDIREEVFGTALKISPRLKASIALSDILEITSNLSIDKIDTEPPLWLPNSMQVQTTFNPTTLELNLEDFSIHHPKMSGKASGNAHLSKKNDLNVYINANIDDLVGKGEISATINGPLTAPALQATGHIDMPAFTNNGLSPLDFEIIDENITGPPLGRVVIKTAYAEKPVEVSANVLLQDNILEIADIHGAAPALSLEGAIKLDTKTTLAHGSITLNATDFAAYSDLLRLDIQGAGHIKADLLSIDTAQALDINISLDQCAYESIYLQSATLKTTIANLHAPWPDQFSVQAKDFRPVESLTFPHLNATLKKNEETKTYTLSLQADGYANHAFTLKGSADIQGMQTTKISAENINLKIASRASSIKIGGRADQQTLDLNAKTQNFLLSDVPLAMPIPVDALRLTSQLRAHGPLNAPIIKANAAFQTPGLQEKSEILVDLKGDYNNKNLTITMIGKGEGIDTLNGALNAPMQISIMPFALNIPQSEPMRAHATLESKLGVLSPLVLPAGQELQGHLSAQAVLKGTLQNTNLNGTINIRDGRYMYDALGIKLDALNMNAEITPEVITLQSLSAKGHKGGVLNASGRAEINNDQIIDLAVTLDNLSIANSNDLKGVTSAQLKLEGQENDYHLCGNITLGQFDIIIPERFKSSIPSLNIAKPESKKENNNLLDQVHLDIGVQAENKIFVRGWGLDAEFGGALDIDGTLATPELNGNMQALRGRYEEFGRKFSLNEAYLRFQGAIPPSPYLSITASIDAEDIKASVHLSGSVSAPELGLSSTPSLPDDEVLSRILFGKNIEKITPFQAIKLKQTLDSFTGKGGSRFDPLEALRDATGLDDLRVDTNDDEQTSVGAGKYLAEGVYLELEKGSGEQSGAANIQVEITPSISLESEVGQDAQAGASLLWKRDY